eukprot:CAMPEP_0205862854 /NCGR_PEP_ID=MMETSP1083-20121108/6520_1 /ASSEMBLY_ACC=CAM_ASM_000430 /TAXON_ID=97485 /ORGANISM="Prymnesium parvum, Strain Texoma1" /LENGTH=456 /DNA_ID=CAMNT_0053224643 /DNA_START=187 /DNA_END=1558 /DNA_ORIENTATION=+
MSVDSKELVANFQDTIEELGLADIAAEVGLSHNHSQSNGAGMASSSSACGAGPSSASTPGPSKMDMFDDDAKTPTCAITGHSGGSAGSGPGSAFMYSDEPAAKKKRPQRAHGSKQQGDKGLRHFSMKVCEKVEQKVRTTYNEVADELVAEFAAVAASEMVSPADQAYDEKNIRRRVYDALNVLMAMDIITKEKKNIMWRGLPTNTEQEGARLQMDLSSRKERVEKKTQLLQELVTQQISVKNLIQRNSSSNHKRDSDQLALPFIIVNTRKDTVVDCEMAEDRQEIFFNFSAPFEIHDDTGTLMRMHMQHCDPAQLPELLPAEVVEFAAHYMHRKPEQGGEPWQPPGLRERCQEEDVSPPELLSALAMSAAAAESARRAASPPPRWLLRGRRNPRERGSHKLFQSQHQARQQEGLDETNFWGEDVRRGGRGKHPAGAPIDDQASASFYMKPDLSLRL